jgi:hypothetical protein
MFQQLFELAIVTLAINSKTSFKEWQRVKKCLLKAIPPNLTKEERNNWKNAESYLDVMSTLPLLESLIREDQNSIESERLQFGRIPPQLETLWTTWEDLSSRRVSQDRTKFMRLLFEERSSRNNIVLIKRKQVQLRMAKYDPATRKCSLQQMILTIFPHDGISLVALNNPTQQNGKQRKRRREYSHQENESLLVGAVRFGGAWDQILTMEGSNIHEERTKIHLEVSDLELEIYMYHARKMEHSFFWNLGKGTLAINCTQTAEMVSAWNKCSGTELSCFR